MSGETEFTWRPRAEFTVCRDEVVGFPPRWLHPGHRPARGIAAGPLAGVCCASGKIL